MATNNYIFGPDLNSNNGLSGGQYFQIGRVTRVILGPYKGDSRERDPDYGSPYDIGKIKYEILYSTLGSSKPGEVNEPAWPMFNFLRQYPVVNEIVLILAGPTEKLNDGSSKQQYFYFPPYALWNKANHGAFPNMAQYSKFLKDFQAVQGYSGTSVSGSLPLGYTFQENELVRNLQPFEGDTIMQGRFGQSIRFGSTVQGIRKTPGERYEPANTWSNSPKNGDPITIILNSQAQIKPDLKFSTMVENINKDGSAIYMTSTQEIFLEDINNFPLNSFGTPITPIIQPTLRVQVPPTSNFIISPAAQDQSNIG